MRLRHAILTCALLTAACGGSQRCVHFDYQYPFQPGDAATFQATVAGEGAPFLSGGLPAEGDPGWTCWSGAEANTDDHDTLQIVAWIHPDAECADLTSASCAPQTGEPVATAQVEIHAGQHVTVPLDFE